MMQITAIRHIPPVVVGSCGTVRHRAFEDFEAALDALEATGVTVERIAADAHDESSLPVVLINSATLCEGRYPSRREWVHALGEVQRAEHLLECGVLAL